MAETWFISDTHFGHKNILEYEKEYRPFNSVEEMNECIIDRWNSVVNVNDIVYHLGDFAFGRHNIQIAERLKGKKKLILGNHDTYPVSAYLQYFDKVYGAFYFRGCLLTHIPVHEYNLTRHLESYGIESPRILNVHGHLHSRNIKQSYEEAFKNPEGADIFGNNKNYFNVSCEQNNLTPINWNVIKERLDEINYEFMV